MTPARSPAELRSTLPFEATGWSRIANDSSDLDRVSFALAGLGFAPEDFDLGPHLPAFREHFAHPLYQGSYRSYPGAEAHAIVEKSLEHFLSLIVRPLRPGETMVDIGSCLSVVPQLVRERTGASVFEQDLEYPAGVHGWRIGSDAGAIPLADRSVDLMTLHCTFEHFEGGADTAHVRECGRLLRPGGAAVILPLYLNLHHVNITGLVTPEQRTGVGWDLDATWHCVIPEWQNRFGRHYSPAALMARVLQPARTAGLAVRLLRVCRLEALDARLWCKWMLILSRP